MVIHHDGTSGNCSIILQEQSYVEVLSSFWWTGSKCSISNGDIVPKYHAAVLAIRGETGFISVIQSSLRHNSQYWNKYNEFISGIELANFGVLNYDANIVMRDASIISNFGI